MDDPAYKEAERAFNARHFCCVGRPPEIERMAEARSHDVYRAMWGPNEWTMTGKLVGWDVRDRLHEITVPTLLTAGRHDLCTQLFLEELQEGFPDAPTILFDNSSHTPYLEEPRASSASSKRSWTAMIPLAPRFQRLAELRASGKVCPAEIPQTSAKRGG